jgi:hypothetical protein
VIVGRLIPAGTGLSNYTRVEVLSQGEEEEAPAGEAPVEVAAELPGDEMSEGDDEAVPEAG